MTRKNVGRGAERQDCVHLLPASTVHPSNQSSPGGNAEERSRAPSAMHGGYIQEMLGKRYGTIVLGGCWTVVPSPVSHHIPTVLSTQRLQHTASSAPHLQYLAPHRQLLEVEDKYL